MQDVVATWARNAMPTIVRTIPSRILIIKARPHVKRGGHKGKSSGPGNQGKIVLATNLLDVPAHLIASIYQYRWSIEIFFRFFKQLLGCRHLLSQRIEGIGNTSLLRGHRLHADQPVDGQETPQANGKRAGLVLHGYSPAKPKFKRS